MQKNDFLDSLSAFVSIVFDDEDGFKEKFWEGDRSDELIEICFGPDKSRIHVLVESGATITSTIDTRELIDWCISINSKSILFDHEKIEHGTRIDCLTCGAPGRMDKMNKYINSEGGYAEFDDAVWFNKQDGKFECYECWLK